MRIARWGGRRQRGPWIKASLSLLKGKGIHLREAGEKRLDGQSRAADLKVVVSQASGHPDGGHDPGLKEMRRKAAL